MLLSMTQSSPDPSKGISRMRPLYLPDTVMGDDTAMVEEFYHYVNRRDGAGWTFGPVISTGPDSDVFAALYYTGEVRNGGHEQFFVHVDGNSDILDAALSGLAEIGADSHHAVLSEMRAWTEANPHYLEMMMRGDMPSPYRPGRPVELDALDGRFFDEQDRHSIEAHTAAWIKACPDLRVVTQAEYTALVKSYEAAAASTATRLGGARVGLLERVMTTIFGR